MDAWGLRATGPSAYVGRRGWGPCARRSVHASCQRPFSRRPACSGKFSRDVSESIARTDPQLYPPLVRSSDAKRKNWRLPTALCVEYSSRRWDNLPAKLMKDRTRWRDYQNAGSSTVSPRFKTHSLSHLYSDI